MTLIIDSGYTPVFPENPADEDTFTDINTGIEWVYDDVAGWEVAP